MTRATEHPPADATATHARPPSSSSSNSTRQLVHLLRTHNHHVTLVSTSRLSATTPSASVTPAHSVRSTIPPAPCCFDHTAASMAPKPAAHRAHRANSVYSTPSSSRPSRHPSSMHHRFGKFNPASRRAFHALFSRRLRPRSPDAHQATISTDPGARITEERLKVLTDENARLRARVVELMSRILCGTTDDGLATVDLNGEGVRVPGDILRADAGSASSSKLHASILPTSLSASPIVRFSATDSNEVSPPPSRAPSDGVTPAPLVANMEDRLRAEAQALRASLEHAAKENERLKKRVTELQERSQREVQTIEEEKEELEEKLCAAREDREVMQNELSELREWSKRNIALKEAMVEAVKKEFAETREEVELLNELIESMRQEQAANRVNALDSDDSESQQLSLETVIDAKVEEEDIITPDLTEEQAEVGAEETVVKSPTDDEAPADEEEDDAHVLTRGDSSTSAPPSLVEDGDVHPEHIDTPEIIPEVKSTQEVDAHVVTDEPPSEERKVEVEEEEEISPIPQPVAECSFSITEERGQSSSGLALVTKKIQAVDIEKEEEKVREMNDKRLREAELRNPLMNVEREQIIVGHFCGHVVQTVGQLLGKGHDLWTKEEEVKQLIAQQWAKWVARSITKVELIESLVNWVRSCCDKGAETDVVASFNAWYVAQYAQYKHRAGPEHANAADGGGKMRRTLSKAEAKSSGQSSEGGSNRDGSMVRRLMEASSGSANKDGSSDKVRVSRRSQEIVRRRVSHHIAEGSHVVRGGGMDTEIEAKHVQEGDSSDVRQRDDGRAAAGNEGS